MTPEALTSSLSSPLPSFKNPPINEVFCGMKFNPPANIRIPHIGFLWENFRKDYPNVQHAIPIASTKGDVLTDEVTGLPIQRVWFINKLDDQLIQFQFDRFYFNWRRRQGEYPRYDFVIKQFESIRNVIAAFLKEFELGELEPVEYELSYINLIPIGEGDASSYLKKIFSDFVWSHNVKRFLPQPEKMTWTVEFPMREKFGRLAVTLKQGIRSEDKIPLFVLELRAKGSAEAVDNNMRKWFDVAHEWIVRGFTDLTTPEFHSIWGRDK